MSVLGILAISIQVLLVVVASGLALHQLWVVLSAERGRQQDLVRRVYKGQFYPVAVLVPWVCPSQQPAIEALLLALEALDYPANMIHVHLGQSPTVQAALAQGLDPLKSHLPLHFWQKTEGASPEHPSASALLQARETQLLPWLADRVLATSNSTLLLVLRPGDLVKPDFLKHLVSKASEASVLQGYVAVRDSFGGQKNWLNALQVVKSRLYNRITLTGRYYAGLGMPLQSSGFAIKANILEKYPLRPDASNQWLEYALLLQARGVKVAWAPHAVTYQHLVLDSGLAFKQAWQGFSARWELFFRYGGKVLGRLLAQPLQPRHWRLSEQLLGTVCPGAFGLANIALIMAVFSMVLGKNPSAWLALLGLTVVLHALALTVARCRLQDVKASLLYTPLFYAGLWASLPAQWALSLKQNVSKQAKPEKRYLPTRFNEALPALAPVEEAVFSTAQVVEPTELDDSAFPQGNQAFESPQTPLPEKPLSYEALLDAMLAKAESEPIPFQSPQSTISIEEQALRTVVGKPPNLLAEPPLFNHQAPPNQPVERTSEVPLRVEVPEGEPKQVVCTLKTTVSFNSGRPVYQLTFQYKQAAFTTPAFNQLEKAYEELQAKLSPRGLGLITCGSCACFKNSAVSQVDGYLPSGACLLGKYGQEINPRLDKVTVISPACPHYLGLSHRGPLQQLWQQSLS